MAETGRRTLQVEPLAGYAPDAGRWLWALQDVRQNYTLRFIEGLDQRTLDWEGPDGRENAIGTLLYHIALVELDWLFWDLLQLPELPPQVRPDFPHEHRGADGRLTPVLGEALDTYRGRLARSRAVFLDTIQRIPAADWRQPREPEGEEYTVTPEWVVYHLVEHEAGHAYQIGALKRRAARQFGGPRRR